ncbi:hypothetical protein BC939DRAFT_457601 [Gamsiella multidivaricata]|uniref:uncharacterized protein n=1 Tax=Gamsiella multidivaricata TaxID=101098 RepID=UPI002221208B|nr:uncharacterized protein BC939DRAFT_457601 [Gamsiella multidivaricata]KAG0363475.1 hypothetical protein BGZ54_008144 [Gamsiella multidivaricata]KAI7820533.1 hypothetical protein BC939DRAFT_457601 [Gamsiella multidivaricata]
MERSFSHLLRTSRLATFDKNIAQIYTTPQKAKAIGDWGLKRNLPTVLRTHNLYIEQLDTAEHQTPFQSATSDYLFLQRWKENFPRSRPPQPQPVTVKKDLATMTDAEFQKLLQSAKEKRQAWKEALAENKVRSDDHLDFMNIMPRDTKGGSIDTATSQATVGVLSITGASGTSTTAPLTGSNTRVKVGPTYGFFEPSTPTIVQGRSLGRTKSNQVIGVCGVVASLPTYNAPHLQNALQPSKSLQPYYVYRADLDADGRPNVVLGHTAPGPGHWLTGSLGGRDHYNYNGSSRLPQGAASNTTNKSSAEANPGRKVISRVQDLLEERDKFPSSS